VPPFSEAIPWDQISLHFHAQQLYSLLDVLETISDERIARMQSVGRRVWEEQLQPGAVNTTFYSLLRKRVSFTHAPVWGGLPVTTPAAARSGPWAGGAFSLGARLSLNPTANQSCGRDGHRVVCVDTDGGRVYQTVATADDGSAHTTAHTTAAHVDGIQLRHEAGEDKSSGDARSDTQTWTPASVGVDGPHTHNGDLLGLMITSSSSALVLGSWLRRHAPIFELLAVLDSSPPGSVAANQARSSCAAHANCRHQLERETAIASRVTDQTAREACTRLLVRELGASSLSGRWILIAHPDEVYVQDPRELVEQLMRRSPRVNAVSLSVVYAMPTPSEREAVQRALSRAADGRSTFEIIECVHHADGAYHFHEQRLFRWEPGTRWGTRHGLTLPQVHPNHVHVTSDATFFVRLNECQ
jgi:hypothetical protein